MAQPPVPRKAATTAKPEAKKGDARPMAWTLRKATLDDLPVLVRHRDAMWVEMGRVPPGEHDPTSEAYAEWIRARMEGDTLTAFLFEDKGKVLGSGAVWIQEVQPRPGHPLTKWGYILSVYTEPEARRRGLAKAIVDACIREAKEVGCTRACLHASDEGRPLYLKMGFEPTAEMWLDLRPPEERPTVPAAPGRPPESRASQGRRRRGRAPLGKGARGRVSERVDPDS